jgi:hypothetical protein
VASIVADPTNLVVLAVASVVASVVAPTQSMPSA